MATKPTELDEAQQALETKLKHIAITREKTEKIISSNNEQRIERHRDALKDLVNAADSSKRTVEGLKIANGEDIESITEWGEKIENTIGQADIDLDTLQKWIIKTKEHTTAKSRKEQLDFEKELYEAKLHYKTQLEETKQQQIGGETSSSMSRKIIYRDICDAKLPWDAELDGVLESQWLSCKRMLPDMITVPRPIARHQEPITDIQHHGFGHASNQGVSAVVYALAKQDSRDTQTLVAAKSRLAKRGLTIPWLELVAGHMTANLVSNVAKVIGQERVSQQHDGMTVQSLCIGYEAWGSTDSLWLIVS
ncbi:Hypothetical predicted protein [Paramuricea clavata]|uniref:Uncharacterized protein n=1 Tax=Paramuricea clavata TaxID=317549 RepID=A0A7D9IRR3_PARCT|nr:Hypothetical predicted protein [Paramuricea clavata]